MNQPITFSFSTSYITISVILCKKQIILERGFPYTLKSPNKQLMHTFLHFVICLQNRFYTLAPISVFNVDIYSSSLRLFKIDLVVSLLPATLRQCFILMLSLPFTLVSRYICFKYLDCVKRAIF